MRPPHVLPDEFLVPQKKGHECRNKIPINFHNDFKWVRRKKVKAVKDYWVYYFSQTRKVRGNVWLVENYICVKTQLVGLRRCPTYFEDKACFECTLT